MSPQLAPATDQDDIVGRYINGAEVPDRRRLRPVSNPATGDDVRHVAMASAATVADAVATAQAAFPVWRDTPPMKRIQIMFRDKQLLEDNADAIVALMQTEILPAFAV